LVWVVGFGGFRDIGGLVLGFRVGGERGSRANVGKFCLPGPDVVYTFPIGNVAVMGGENGIVDGGYELFRGLTGLERSGFGNEAPNICIGDEGGDGVDVVERNVGPGPVEIGDAV
jgi:hypothetical protein